MKILLISPIPPPVGGIASWTKSYLNSEGIKEQEVDIVNTSVVGKRKYNATYNMFDELKRLRKIIENINNNVCGNSYDIAHINTSCGSLGLIKDILCAIKIKKRMKVVLQCHCNVPDFVKGKFSKFLFNILISSSNKVIVLNESSKKFVWENFGKESVIVPNFIESKHILTKITNEEDDSKIETITFSGRISIEKGCDTIYEVAKKFPDKTFNLIGNPNCGLENLPAPQNVNLLGVLEKESVLEHLSNSDMFLFPTHTEGFPCSVLEAMAKGLPIISTRVGAIGDMIEHKGGFLVPIGDVELICKYIDDLDNDTLLRKNIGAWNIKKVQEYYSDNVVINKLIDIYKGVIHEGA